MLRTTHNNRHTMHPDKLPLGFFPTPISHLTKLSTVLGGPQLYMKRDDLTGLALGGNKTRKLAFILQHAVNQGCDTIVTAGAAQSNHCRQTAAAAASLGLKCHLLLGGQAPPSANGNLLLDQLLGATIHWAGEHRKGEDIPHIAATLKAQGKSPYLVPYGGSNTLGAYSFVDALEEVEAQIDMEKFSHIFFASSSGGTHAGMMLGKALLQRQYQLVGINIDKGETDAISFYQFITQLANETGKMLNVGHNFTLNDLQLDNSYVGEGYGVVGDAEREAINLTAKHEGILLDPVYTGRAMAGLIDWIRRGKLTKEDNVMFWHTGGTPALFAYTEALN